MAEKDITPGAEKKPAKKQLSAKQKTTAVANAQPTTEIGGLLQLAIKQDLDVEKLERLIDLKNQEEDRLCKKEFELHFSEMQRELLPVKKNKDGSKTNAGVVTFKYAPLEEVQRVNNPVISKHGFSYKWREEKEESGDKRVRIIISGYGHTDDKTYFDIPKIGTNSLTTDVQTRGMQSSYGKRYTLIAGFGMTIEGEDDESKLELSEGLEYIEALHQISTAQNEKDLHELFKTLWIALGNDQKGKAVITEAKNKRKKELEG